MEFLLMGEKAAAKGGLLSQGAAPILMLVAMFAIFYFLLIRPQQKRQKELKRKISEMREGDKVVTGGGVKGKVEKIKEDSVIVNSNGVSVEVVKGYIQQVER